MPEIAQLAAHSSIAVKRGWFECDASIKLVLNAIGTECEVGVLPIENFSEGFIPDLNKQG